MRISSDLEDLQTLEHQDDIQKQLYNPHKCHEAPREEQLPS